LNSVFHLRDRSRAMTITLTIDNFPEEMFEHLQEYAAENDIDLRTATVLGLMRGLAPRRPAAVPAIAASRGLVRA
jgi:hypothetical protein